MSVYAISDLHGRLDLYQEVKKFLKPEDTVYCLGDCGDRGPKPWETIKAVASDPQFIYLLGNHEHMLLGAMCEYLDIEKPADFNNPMFKGISMTINLVYNGGMDTLQGWIDEGAKTDWIKFFRNMPTSATYKNILLSHAGYSMCGIPSRIDQIWDRHHFFEEWPEGDESIMVHGHTPCPILVKEFQDMQKIFGREVMPAWQPQDGAVTYANGHKIDIDMGSFATGHTLLLNLDTFDEHIFIGPEPKELIEK